MSNAEYRMYGPPRFQDGRNRDELAQTLDRHDVAGFGSRQASPFNPNPCVVANTASTSLVVFDSSIEDYAVLADGTRNGYQINVLDGSKNGLEELTRHLLAAAPVAELHIVSHGSAGEIRLGEAVLSAATFEIYAESLRAWSHAFAENGEIHIYGCDVAAGAAGRDLIARLADVTGTAVAASRDRTGAAEAGGNWELGLRLGSPRAGLPFTSEALERFTGHLDASSGNGNQNGTIGFLASELATAFAAAGYGSSLSKIKISWLSGDGALTLDGQDVLPGQEISLQQIGGLLFTPAADYEGTAEFGWLGHDGSGYVGATLMTGAPTASEAGSDVTVNTSTNVVGDLGNQTWGDVEVTGTGLDGSERLVTWDEKGLGVDGGRADHQIDFAVQTTYVPDDSGGTGNNTPPPDPSGVTYSNELSGVWAKAFQSEDGSWPDKLFNMANDPLVKGIVIVPNWYTLEPEEGQYDWSSIYDAIGRAEAMGKEVTITPYAQTFHSLADNPYTAGVPKYIVDDHQTYGGSPGHGGLEAQKNNSGWAVRRWDSEVMDRLTEMYQALVEEFDGNPSVPMLMFGPETSLKLDTPNIPDYSPEKYVAEYAELMEEVAATAQHMELSMQMNWLPEWGNKGIQALYDVAKANGISVGSPDLMATPKEMPYYDVFEAAEVPVDISVQMPSLKHIKNGAFTVEEMVQTGIDMGMRMMYVAAWGENNTGISFNDVLDAIKNNPGLLDWATNGVDPDLLAAWNDGEVETVAISTGTSSVVEIQTEVSEELIFDFREDVAQVTIQISRLLSDDAGVSGNQEVGEWKALDAEGDVVAEGLFVPDLGTMVNDSTYDFTINVGQPFDKLVVSAANYNADPDNLVEGENSDFSVTKIAYSTVDPDNVDDPNQIPVVAEAARSGLEDEVVEFSAADFKQAFSDADGDSLSMIKITALPSHGELSLNGSPLGLGAEISINSVAGLTFTPPADWSGTASFSWIGRDGGDYAKTAAAFNLNIGAVNDAPVASNDGTFEVAHNGSLVIDSSVLSGNDTDIDGDVIFVSSVGNAANGSVLLSVETEVGTNGGFGPSIVFTPESGFSGAASFDYVISDGAGGSSTATVNLDVAGLDDAAPDPVTLVANLKTLSGALGDQMWGDIRVSAEGWNGEPALVAVRQYGGLGVSGGRTDKQIGFSGQDEDGDGIAGDSEKVTLDFPDAVSGVSIELARMSANELGGNVEVGTWQAYDANGDQVAVGLFRPNAAVQTGNNSYRFDISAGQSFSKLVVAAANYNHDASNSGTTNNSDFSVRSVTYQPAPGSNSPPIAIDDNGYTTYEDTPLLLSSADLISNDLDLDLDLLLMKSVGNASHGSVDLVGDTIVFNPEDGFVGRATFDYTIHDGHSGSSTAKVRLDVKSVEPMEVAAVKGSLTGESGDQQWGDIKVSGKAWDGSDAPVELKWSGLGVAGGRFAYQVDFSVEDKDGDGVGGDSEELVFDFPYAVEDVTIIIGALATNDKGMKGMNEVGKWQAFDDAGTLVGQGMFDTETGSAMNNNSYKFDLSNETGSFSKLIVSATYYNNDSSNETTSNNSDFQVRGISYQPAVSDVVAENAGGSETTDDLSVLALDVAISDSHLDTNGLDETLQVL